MPLIHRFFFGNNDFATKKQRAGNGKSALPQRRPGAPARPKNGRRKRRPRGAASPVQSYEGDTTMATVKGYAYLLGTTDSDLIVADSYYTNGNVGDTIYGGYGSDSI